MTSIDEIITKTKVTKEHFIIIQDQMGLAIIDEIVKRTIQNAFIKPLQDVENLIKEI